MAGLRGIRLQQQLLLGAIILAALAASKPNSSCISTCGSLRIPYPFGTSEGCYLDPSSVITCNDTVEGPTPFLASLKARNLKLLNISLDGELIIMSNFVATDCYDMSGSSVDSKIYRRSSPKFPISYTRNKITAVGCDTYVVINGTVEEENFATGCISVCDNMDRVVNGSCSGIGCCQTSIPQRVTGFQVSLKSYNNHSAVGDLRNRMVPMVLDWAVGNEACPDAKKNLTSYACKAAHSERYNSTNGPGYRCNCSSGYEENPYLSDGCQDIDECEISKPCNNTCTNIPGSFKCYCPKGYEGDGMTNGTGCRPVPTNSTHSTSIAVVLGISSGIGLLVLLVGGWWSYKVVKKRKMIKQNNVFFKRNGGLLIQQKLSSHEANVENTKLFNLKDLEMATDHFNVNRILGQGGQGTVYKGMLADGKIVAVKKSKVMDEEKLTEFINEVVILSQINHRNVVKLIGYCLETEVPLLVYEYVPNGTLFQYINGQIEEFSLAWYMRLRIATEVAGAIFYLHSIASTPIYHRDIKSTNILLDDKYIAKVADFGISRSITVDQTHLTTLVHGTFGYLDPEYFQSSQFTEKSDVYSFGVVLVELLTGEKAISSTRTEESKSLAIYFIQSVEDNNLFDIIDSQVFKEGKKEEIIAVANLAKRCLNSSGKKRPTMKEVVMELEAVQMLQFKRPTMKVSLSKIMKSLNMSKQKYTSHGMLLSHQQCQPYL